MADRDDFAMRGRIAIGERAVERLCDHFAITNDDAADRHLAGCCRSARLVESDGHEGGH
jgi:hypothetical protein